MGRHSAALYLHDGLPWVCAVNAVRIESAARCRACRQKYLVSLVEFKEQAKLENQVKALQASLEAQERESENRSRRNSMSEPPAEILEALQMLAAENAKLRVELDRTKAENAELRSENAKL